MLFNTKSFIASACALMLAGSAVAGASLDTLLGGGSLFSNNGELEFSDFEFIPILNAPQASDIQIQTLDSGLSFNAPASADSNSGDVAFELAYKVTGVNGLIEGIIMQSSGSATGGGVASIYKTIEDERDQAQGLLSGVYLGDTALKLDELMLDGGGSSSVYVTDAIYADANGGNAELGEFEQTFTTSDVAPTAAPSPTAALAGAMLLGAIGLRRRRGGDAVKA